ncbi:MAG: hypothetical protein V1760_00965 [Candidatus Peregrinibacteria bacterium]
MQKVIFNITKELSNQIDGAIAKWGFASRAEFLRYAAIDFIRHDARLMPADDTLKEHAKAIKSVKSRQNLAELRRTWYRPELEGENL